MTRIRVNPNTLNQTAGSVTRVGGGVRKLGDDVWRSASSAPSYQGQFGPKVRAIGQSALSQAQKHTNRMNQLSGSLDNRAAMFLKADTISINSTIFHSPNPILSIDPALLKKLQAWLGLPISYIMMLLKLGILNKEELTLPAGFINTKENDLGRSKRIVNELNDFKKSETGRKLAADAMAAGLLFNVYDNGRIVAQWGVPGGKEISIEFEDIEKTNGKNFDGYAESGSEEALYGRIAIDTKFISSDPLLCAFGGANSLANVLSHEMRHKIDEYTWMKAEQDKLGIYSLSNDELRNYSIDQLEKEIAQDITSRVKSEINAHDIGFQEQGGMIEKNYGSKLDSTDGVYSKQEFEFVINERDYKSIYQDQYNEFLDEIYGNTSLEVDVFLDENGIVQVNIENNLKDFISLPNNIA